MVNEGTHLLGGDNDKRSNGGSRVGRLENQDAEYEIDEEVSIGRGCRVVLYGIGIFVTLAFMYVFIIFLPQKYVPEARVLDGIPKIQSLDVVLKPISSQRAFELHGDTGMGEGSVVYSDGLDKEVRESEEEHITDSLDLEEHSKGHKRPVERIVMVGDVHGNHKPLLRLMKKLNYRPKSDHVLLLGDFTCKGPHSLQVVDYAIENNLDCILGNHEYYLLKYYTMFHRLEAPQFLDEEPSSDFTAFGYDKDPDFTLAKKIQPRHVEYINKCSVIKKLGAVPSLKASSGGGRGSAEGVAVHAGLRWDLSLEDQDPVDCMEMRSYLGPFYNETTDDPRDPRAVSWSKVFNKKQKELDPSSRKVVYYGHDARRGLKIKRYTKGLDAGCNRGDSLSAIVIWKELKESATGKQILEYKEAVVSVGC